MAIIYWDSRVDLMFAARKSGLPSPIFIRVAIKSDFPSFKVLFDICLLLQALKCLKGSPVCILISYQLNSWRNGTINIMHLINKYFHIVMLQAAHQPVSALFMQAQRLPNILLTTVTIPLRLVVLFTLQGAGLIWPIAYERNRNKGKEDVREWLMTLLVRGYTDCW